MTVEDLARSVSRRTGLSFSGVQRERMLAALAAGHDDPADLIAALTVAETHFFREAATVSALQHHVLPELAAARPPEQPVTVWSAGCATGEEAYTIAMAAREVGLGRRVRVLGTDLSAHAIAVARRAEYGPWSLRGVSEVRRRAFFRGDGRRWTVVDPVRRPVLFAVHNLLDGPPGRFDLVVCRNVLIYLTAAATAHATEVLRAGLRPGGWLLTGASDPPLRSPGLQPQPTAAGLRYRACERPARRRREAPPATPSAATPRPAAASVPETPTRTAAAASLPTTAAPAQQDVARIRALGDAGRAAEALAAAEAAIAGAPLDADLRALAAVLYSCCGRMAEAVTAARAARFLDPHREDAAALLAHARPTASPPSPFGARLDGG